MTTPAMAWTVRLLTVAGLGVDAGIHLYLAPTQPPADTSGGWSQSGLFYAEAAAAIISALLVLTAARRWTYAVAFLVAASAFGAVTLYRYVNVGPLGPLPNMYEPFWSTSKIVAAVAEAIALVTAATGLALLRSPGSRGGPLGRRRDDAAQPRSR